MQQKLFQFLFATPKIEKIYYIFTENIWSASNPMLVVVFCKNVLIFRNNNSHFLTLKTLSLGIGDFICLFLMNMFKSKIQNKKNEVCFSLRRIFTAVTNLPDVLGISQNLRRINRMRLNYSFSTAHVWEFPFIQKKNWKLMPLKQILVPRSLPLHHFYSSIGVICQIDWLWLKGHFMWNHKDHLTHLLRNGWNLVCRFSQRAEQLYQILHYFDKYFLRYLTIKIADQKSFSLNVMLSNILRDTKIGKYVWTHKSWWAQNLHSDRFCTGVGGIVLIFGRVSRWYTWIFYFKDYNTAIQISGTKKEVQTFLVVTTTKN